LPLEPQVVSVQAETRTSTTVSAAQSCTGKLTRPISPANREASGSVTLTPASLKRAQVAA
jgi:hypothetical protein